MTNDEWINRRHHKLHSSFVARHSSFDRCVFLDLGKVLLDFDPMHFRERLRELTGVESEVLREAIAGDDLAHRYESGLMTDVEFHVAVCNRIGARIDTADFVRAWNSIFL